MDFFNWQALKDTLILLIVICPPALALWHAQDGLPGSRRYWKLRKKRAVGVAITRAQELLSEIEIIDAAGLTAAEKQLFRQKIKPVITAADKLLGQIN